MSSTTSIQWTDVTDNIIVAEDGGWWCRKISPGCANCYAAKLNQNSFFGGNRRPYSGHAPKLKLRSDIVSNWERQRSPKKHFVASMTDVFGEWVPWAWKLEFLRGMWRAPAQTFQVLTKRPSLMREVVEEWLAHDGLGSVPRNIWLGASVENQKTADARIPELFRVPVRVRFLSVEPILEPVDLRLADDYTGDPEIATWPLHSGRLSWVIVGGESGPSARSCEVPWVLDVVRQCKSVAIPCFVKQLGSRPGCSPGLYGNKGAEFDLWPKELQVREFPNL